MGVTVSAVCMALAGAVLIFAPDEAGAVFASGSIESVVIQVLGAALFGYGVATWTARGAALGGIYGRAVIAGNQAHFTIGALLLAKHGVEAGPADAAYWVLTAAYVTGAAFFSYLMFFSSGLRTR
jgi:hypothetical protein